MLPLARQACLPESSVVMHLASLSNNYITSPMATYIPSTETMSADILIALKTHSFYGLAAQKSALWSESYDGQRFLLHQYCLSNLVGQLQLLRFHLPCLKGGWTSVDKNLTLNLFSVRIPCHTDYFGLP
jgi:hypothetical protein